MAKTNLLARCILAAGSQSAGILLYRICYWSQYAKVVQDGHVWIVKPAAEWQEEAVLTKKQYESAVSTLKRKLLIEIRVFKFGRALASHVRLLERGKGTKNPLEGELENPLEGGMENPPQGAFLYNKGDTLTKKEGDNCVITAPAQETGPVDKGSGIGYSVPVKEDKKMPTVKELLAAGGKSNKPKSLAKGAGMPGNSVSDAWRDAVSQEYHGYQPPFTQKKIGQFKLLEKSCPPGKAPLIVKKVVTEWGEFVNVVKGAAGLKVVPSEPNLDFVLKHVAHAIKFSAPKEQTVKKPVVLGPKTAKKPVQSIAPTPPTDKATKAEVLSILGSKHKE